MLLLDRNVLLLLTKHGIRSISAVYCVDASLEMTLDSMNMMEIRTVGML